MKTIPCKKFFKACFVLFSLLFFNVTIAQTCDINAGGNVTICGTSHRLVATNIDNASGNLQWSLISKPAGASDPVLSSPTSLATDVTGMDKPGKYVFKITKQCGSTVAESTVTITSPGSVTNFTAGSDITTVSAITGVAQLQGVIPEGYKGEWRFYQLYSYENWSQEITTNAIISDKNSANPTFELTKKADHDVDPAYRVILRITSLQNSNCFYEDDLIVSFIPNPAIEFNSVDFCKSPDHPIFYLHTKNNAPKFAKSTPNSSGKETQLTLQVISQPAGANMTIDVLKQGELYFNSLTHFGVYKFKVIVTNDVGTHTTQEITFNYQGDNPDKVNFVDPNHPEQMMTYGPGSTGGEVVCDYVGSNLPITIYFSVTDVNYMSSAYLSSSEFPPGGNGLSFSPITGTNQLKRSVTVTPPSEGWKAGTYIVYIKTASATSAACYITQGYYIHVSDGNRQDIVVDDMTVCYPGSGIVEAVINLPQVFVEVPNPSYLNGYSGSYEITLVSKPANAADPTYDASNLRTLKDVTTRIKNLNKEGEYRFKIKAQPNSIHVGDFVGKDFACSNAANEAEFSVFVSAQQGANAGSNRVISCPKNFRLNANEPLSGNVGTWHVISAPTGANPIFEDDTKYNTVLNGLDVEGDYVLSWTITTGDCISKEEVTIRVNECKPRLIISNPMMPAKH